jgi:hypothetical protein
MYVSSKALDLGPDLVNRSFFWFLDQLTEEQRERDDILDEIESGKLSTRLRLGALAMIERHNLMGSALGKKRGSSGLRFGVHRALAEAIYVARCNELGHPIIPNAIEIALGEMRAAHDKHTALADDNGVLLSMHEGRDVVIRLTSLFAEMTGTDCQRMSDWINARVSGRPIGRGASKPVQRCTGAQLLRAWCAARALEPDAPLHQVLSHLRGGNSNGISDRSVSLSFSRELRRSVPVGSAWKLPGIAGAAGWGIGRYKDHGGSVQITLEQRAGWAGVAEGTAFAVPEITAAEAAEAGIETKPAGE